MRNIRIFHKEYTIDEEVYQYIRKNRIGYIDKHMFYVHQGKHCSFKKLIINIFTPDVNLNKTVIIQTKEDSLCFKDLIIEYPKYKPSKILMPTDGLDVLKDIRAKTFRSFARKIYRVDKDTILIEFTDSIRVVQALLDYNFYEKHSDLVCSCYPHFYKSVNSYYLMHSKLANSSLLHYAIINKDVVDGFEVDHINRVTLDNRTSNLRVITKIDNLKNKGMYKNNKTGVSGVVDSIMENRFRVIWRDNGKRLSKSFPYKNKDAKQVFMEACKFRRDVNNKGLEIE